MAKNDSSASGFVGMAAENLGLSQSLYVIVAAVVAAAFLLLNFSTSRLDPREPTAVKSSIPLIGHLIGIIRHQAKYFLLLQ